MCNSNKKLAMALLAVTMNLVSAAGRALGEEGQGVKAVWVFPTTVRITNSLSNGLQLRMHCKSKDDDLGDRILMAGQSWEWKFRVNIGESTLFFCGLDTLVGSGSFDVFSAEKDALRCPQHCNWVVKDDGLHGYNEKTGQQDRFFPWPKIN